MELAEQNIRVVVSNIMIRHSFILKALTMSIARGSRDIHRHWIMKSGVKYDPGNRMV